MNYFQAEVISSNVYGPSVGILVMVNFTDMNYSPMANLPRSLTAAKSRTREVAKNNPLGANREFLYHRH